MRHPPETVLYVRASEARVIREIERLPAVASSSIPAAKQLLVRMGLALLGRIKKAFLVKASGGTDEAGDRWKRLSKYTIAYSRRHRKAFVKGGARSTARNPGWLPPPKKRAEDAPSWMLTKKQRERWWQLYRDFGGTAPSGRGYHARNVSRSWAAARAWKILKAEGARTIMGTYGNLQVEILRDTGLLYNSLSPGVSPDACGPAPPKVEDQVFRLGRGEVIIGTNRKHARSHHRGVPGRVPQRRLWPEVRRWPSSWWADVLEQAKQGVIDVILHIFKGVA